MGFEPVVRVCSFVRVIRLANTDVTPDGSLNGHLLDLSGKSAQQLRA